MQQSALSKTSSGRFSTYKKKFPKLTKYVPCGANSPWKYKTWKMKSKDWKPVYKIWSQNTSRSTTTCSAARTKSKSPVCSLKNTKSNSPMYATTANSTRSTNKLSFNI